MVAQISTISTERTSGYVKCQVSPCQTDDLSVLTSNEAKNTIWKSLEFSISEGRELELNTKAVGPSAYSN